MTAAVPAVPIDFQEILFEETCERQWCPYGSPFRGFDTPRPARSVLHVLPRYTHPPHKSPAREYNAKRACSEVWIYSCAREPWVSMTPHFVERHSSLGTASGEAVHPGPAAAELTLRITKRERVTIWCKLPPEVAYSQSFAEASTTCCGWGVRAPSLHSSKLRETRRSES